MDGLSGQKADTEADSNARARREILIECLRIMSLRNQFSFVANTQGRIHFDAKVESAVSCIQKRRSRLKATQVALADGNRCKDVSEDRTRNDRGWKQNRGHKKSDMTKQKDPRQVLRSFAVVQNRNVAKSLCAIKTVGLRASCLRYNIVPFPNTRHACHLFVSES